MKFILANESHYENIANLVSSPEELYLVSPSGQYPWSAAQLKKISTKRKELTVCIVKDEIAAFANLYGVEPNKSAFIGNVIVSFKHRGQGLGKSLMQHMIQKCQDNYNAAPHLSVFSFNEKALLMYVSIGFKPYEIEAREGLNGKQVALIHMRYERKT